MKAIYAPSKEICLTYIQISLRAEESAIMPVPTGGQCCVAARLRERTTSTLHSAVSSRVDPTPTLRRLYVACFISSCAIQMTSTVGRAAAPTINSRESILNSSERKKTKLNSKCRCCVVDSVIRHTMNSVDQYQGALRPKKLVVEGSIIHRDSKGPDVRTDGARARRPLSALFRASMRAGIALNVINIGKKGRGRQMPSRRREEEETPRRGSRK
jgi:hypothetical protein